MDKEQKVITIKAVSVKTASTTFTSYKLKTEDGKAVDLRFRKISERIDVIPLGISKIIVEDLEESHSSFYPRFYATFIKLA